MRVVSCMHFMTKRDTAAGVRWRRSSGSIIEPHPIAETVNDRATTLNALFIGRLNTKT